MFETIHDGVASSKPHRVLRLASFSSQHTYRELVAHLGKGRVTLTRLSNDRKPKSFKLSGDELDELIVAWQAFQGDVEVQAAAEAVRQEGVLKQAFALAATVPDIAIETAEGNPPSYRVHCRVLDNWWWSWTGIPDDLLADVEAAVAAFDTHLETIKSNWDRYNEASKRAYAPLLERYKNRLAKKPVETQDSDPMLF